jgi:protease I
MTEKNNSCDCVCECSGGIRRRDFIKLAMAAGILAGCSPAEPLVNLTDEPTAVPTAAPSATLTAAPTTTSAPAPTTLAVPSEIPDLTDNKVVYIIPRDTYASGCHTASEAMLRDAGAAISLASWHLDEIPDWSRKEPPLKPDILVSDIQAADFDAIIFECGQPLDEDDPEAIRLVHEAVEQNKVLAAICMMPVLLAAAGVLEGKRAACNDGFAATLKAGGAVPSGAQIERDGNIITASFRGHRLFGGAIAQVLAETTIRGAAEPVDAYVARCGHGGCPECPNYGTACDGCLTDDGALAQYAVNCVVRNCNLDHSVANCACCEEYACDKLEALFAQWRRGGFAQAADQAQAMLAEIHQTLSQ